MNSRAIAAQTAQRPRHLPDIHELVIQRLEDAGRTLAMLPMPRGSAPAQPASAWPDVVQIYWDVVGHAEVGSIEDRQHLLALTRLQPRFQANRAAVDRLDEVLGWLWLIRVPHCRKAVAARMLVHPVSLRHVNSFNKIAKSLGTSGRSARRWFEQGVDTIVQGLAADQKNSLPHVPQNAL
jgi:hypothetical protein